MKAYRTNERISAVMKIDDRYVLRQVCEHGLRQEGTVGELYSFPGVDKHSRESEGQAAVRAAHKWGFYVVPSIIIKTEDKTYVICEGTTQIGKPDNERKVLLSTYKELMQDPFVAASVKEFFTSLE
ncbi:MAG: hypothetical protein HY513_03485 [Candidatus Aenigmarchaeota archaeon]|nr:hypothetical protein [Candidatus Aenigmarchaeota archaeon]